MTEAQLMQRIYKVTSLTMRRMIFVTIVLAFALMGFHAAATTRVAAAGMSQLDVDDPIPMMAYYYIWFDEVSWNRAKTDYPALGRYSSDDRAIMEQHVQWAKEAGIDGFIVSWKSTFQLDTRLEQLMEVANENDFKLWIIYQGLDFNRQPLPVDRIASDLQYFIDEYAADPAFAMYDLPILIWSGTWEFSREQIESVTSQYRGHLTILATERNLEGYERLADIVDGNAYYWSSVNPDTFPGYQEKLDELSTAIHENGGLWIAPAAPGFDARLIGGTTIVERKNGETLRVQLDAALNSNPDAIGLISWNEFSENTHVEPSQNYGTEALDVLRGRVNTGVPQPLQFDSSDPGATNINDRDSFFVLGGLIVLVLTCFVVIIYRQVSTSAKKQP